jgi:hypothetical protein
MVLVVRMNLTLPWRNPGGSAVVPTLPPLREGLVGDLQNFKSTASFVEDIRALERDQFRFRPLVLLLATCAHVQALLPFYFPPCAARRVE